MMTNDDINDNNESNDNNEWASNNEEETSININEM